MPGALLDHIPFSRRGYCAGSLICASDRMFLIHTEKNTIDLVEPGECPRQECLSKR
ncbi:uncharacterized protein METZ01_LOCUS100973 [marine metagenome]|uniref:Uncharacterized protein n=1 Tax=marine metagenome TaxID=408172 RepID=A0A381W6D5_9ZZZZ